MKHHLKNKRSLTRCSNINQKARYMRAFLRLEEFYEEDNYFNHTIFTYVYIALADEFGSSSDYSLARRP